MGKTRKLNRSKSKEPYINRLPPEILLDIFVQFWALDYGSPHIFFQVCRNWYAVAQSTKRFWTKIYCGTYWSGDRAPSYIKCPTPDALSKHLLRIEGMKFELHLSPILTETETWAPILRTVLHNCYALRSTSSVDLLSSSSFRNVGYTPPLVDELLKDFGRLYSDPSSPGPSLYTLVYNQSFSAELFDLSPIWNHLCVLSLENTWLPWNTDTTRNLFSSLTNLREILLDTISWDTEPKNRLNQACPAPESPVEIGSKFLTKMTLSCVYLECFFKCNAWNYHSLVELTYVALHDGDTTLQGKYIVLWNLRKLRVVVHWLLVLSIIAPNIEVVEMRRGRHGHLSDIHLFTEMILEPQILHIHLLKATNQVLLNQILDRLPNRKLVELRLEQDNAPGPTIGVMQRIQERVRKGLFVRWNGVEVTGSLEQMATWAESGRLEEESKITAQ
ncbi:hypothetical protein CPB86DRAFT_788691 [Serendipita vermifera]|nr:hypothetical protein CPB86DRAFT_788691 [Serendipita vermifera]